MVSARKWTASVFDCLRLCVWASACETCTYLPLGYDPIKRSSGGAHTKTSLYFLGQVVVDYLFSTGSGWAALCKPVPIATSRRPTKKTVAGGARTNQTLSTVRLLGSSFQNTAGIGSPMAASRTSNGAAARRSWPRHNRAALPHHPSLPHPAKGAHLLAPRRAPQGRGIVMSTTVPATLIRAI
jgi:hypothetical protein